jgi:hypothetical protein
VNGDWRFAESSSLWLSAISRVVLSSWFVVISVFDRVINNHPLGQLELGEAMENYLIGRVL